MISNLDNSILKELDHQNFRADIISIVMNKLNNNEIKNKFLSYMIENRNVVITLKDLFCELKEMEK